MGRVTCNGQVCVLGQTADPDTDILALDGKILDQAPQDRVYLMLHKPRGFVTTLSDEKGRKNAAQLVADCGRRVYPVGRLDMDSEGLLLLTNDGELTNRLTHPSHEVEKTYEVWTTGYTAGAEERLKMPIVLDGYPIKPPKVRLLKSSGNQAHLLVTIHEGRNRQVRRMCDLAGMGVARLIRICEGTLKLGDLKSGSWRFLSDREVEELRK